jgi:hypothetical protein
VIRNLLYNCFAPIWSQEWELNVERLCRYADVFNGRRIILIKNGEKTEDPQKVEASFAPLGECEFMHYPNDPALGEVVGFVDALSRLESLRPDEVMFYAHTKGCKYIGVPDEAMLPIRQWRNRMYIECLTDMEKIERIVAMRPCAGCFRQKGSHPPLPPNSVWHFAGTFWWVRHDALFSRDWRTVTQHTHGVEAYLGTLFPYTESFCLYGDQPSYSLYVGNGHYECERCGHEFASKMSPFNNRKKICPKCHKRRGRFVLTEPLL